MSVPPYLEPTRFANRNVLFVMAVEFEYGPKLRSLFTPLMTGVGPVESGIAVAAELARLRAMDMLPDLVVSLGSAGSRKLVQTGIYQVVSVSYRDMDASALGVPKGQTPFLELPATLQLPLRIPEIAEASLSTGANVVSGAAYDSIDADMVDMETYAVLRAGQAFGVPVIALRGISDGKAELKHVDDWREYLDVIDRKLAEAVETLEKAIRNGLLEV